MPLPLLASAGIGLAGDLVSQLFGNQAAKQQTQEQNQMNYDNWVKQQEYNSPKNQMQRYADAGLNPQLIYGQGTPGNATAPPVTSAPQKFAPKIDAIGHYQNAVQVQQLQQTVENLKTNQELMKQNQDLKDAQTDLLKKQSAWYDQMQSNKIQMLGSNMNLNLVKQGLMRGQVDKLDSDIMMNKQRAAFMGNEDLRQASLNSARVRQMGAQTDLMQVQKLNTELRNIAQQTTNGFLAKSIMSVINRNEESTNSLIEGQQTQQSIRSLNLAKQAFMEYQMSGKISDQILKLLGIVIK
ncbi:MAG: DNA pilot protein [Microvirus sp.]|nr:MAG: DNA pilot protein [Microvirus sp.]